MTKRISPYGVTKFVRNENGVSKKDVISHKKKDERESLLLYDDMIDKYGHGLHAGHLYQFMSHADLARVLAHLWQDIVSDELDEDLEETDEAVEGFWAKEEAKAREIAAAFANN